MVKDLSEDKKNIYKDLSKTVERYRHLPKLKFNSKEHDSLLSSYEPASYQSINVPDHGNTLYVLFSKNLGIKDKSIKRKSVHGKKDSKQEPIQTINEYAR